MPYSALLHEKFQLLDIRDKALASLKNAPTGSLRVSYSHGRCQYYQVLPNLKYRYLKPSKDEKIIKALAQKGYDETVLCQANAEVKRIERFLHSAFKQGATKLDPMVEASGFGAKAAYLKLRPEVRQYVEPYALTASDYADRWENKSHPQSWIDKEGCIFATEKGDYVRSKSEVIIADKLFRAGVPYRYEQPLELGSKTFHPDFTVLDKNTRTEVIWEHFGMMDDPLYTERALSKINAYAQNGYVLGNGLIITLESTVVPLNTPTLDAIIERLL